MAENETALIPSVIPDDHGQLAAPENEVAAVFADQAPDLPDNPQLSVVRIDHGNQRLLLNGEPVDSVEGYPIYWFQSRAWWSEPYAPGSHTPPACYSDDMVKPSRNSEDPQAKTCAECPHSAFGSATVGRGQACRTNTMLFLCNPAFGTPPIAVLILPPTSIGSLLGRSRSGGGYLSRAKQFKGDGEFPARRHEIVWTSVSVSRPSPDAIHCVAAFQPVGICRSPEEARALAEICRQSQSAMEALRNQTVEISMEMEDEE